MDLALQDVWRLLHPMLAVTVVFPSIGIVVYMAWQTRQRRLQVAHHEKSKIPPTVGQEHLRLGRWLAVAVVAIELLGITRPLLNRLSKDQVWTTNPTQGILVVLMYIVAIGSLVCLLQARPKLWRGIFATLAGAAIVVLSLQPGIFRRDDGKLFQGEWFVSHWYYGVTVTLLMIFSLAIIQDIYRSMRWRVTHIVLNCIAVLLFIGQGMTGTRDLLEIPLSWQEPFIYQCDFVNKTCPQPAPPPGQS
jgi:membrane protein YdbS with pleckstrin-like domain